LTDDWYIDASDVDVKVNTGIVTLSGRVETRAEKRRAEDLANLIAGVTDVNNQLRVGSGASITPETTEPPPRVRTTRP
jgi:osmotically-inducible protein OsmY